MLYSALPASLRRYATQDEADDPRRGLLMLVLALLHLNGGNMTVGAPEGVGAGAGRWSSVC